MYHMYSYVSSCYDAEAPDWYKWAKNGVLPMVAGQVPLGSSWDPLVNSFRDFVMSLFETHIRQKWMLVNTYSRQMLRIAHSPSHQQSSTIDLRWSNTTINGVILRISHALTIGTFWGWSPICLLIKSVSFQWTSARGSPLFSSTDSTLHLCWWKTPQNHLPTFLCAYQWGSSLKPMHTYIYIYIYTYVYNCDIAYCSFCHRFHPLATS